MGQAEHVCGICKTGKILTQCVECRMPLCEPCAVFELLAEGCGTVVPAYFCPSCARDMMVNPNAIFRQE